MFIFMKKQKITAISMLYGMMISLPVVAEDIEIYRSVSNSTLETQANVLFVLDTSGSMDTTVFTRPDYDPTASYSSAAACYDSDRVYTLPGFSFTAVINAVGDTNASLLCTFSNVGFNQFVRQVNRTAVVCNEAASLDITGFYSGKVSQYFNNQWRSDWEVSELDDFIECEADSGIHGETTGDARVYASQNAAAWSNTSTEEMNWGTAGTGRSIYSGNYLNYIISAPKTFAGKTRIEVMKDVVTDFVNSNSKLNIGLMRYSADGNGGMVLVPVADIGLVGASGPGTQRKDFIDKLNAMVPIGNTPLSETFYEAVMYYQGKDVDYGLNSSSNLNFDGDGNFISATPQPSVASSRSGNRYISPIKNECQKNFIVMLTDGDPVHDELNSARKGNIDSGAESTIVSGSGCGSDDDTGLGGAPVDNCLNEISESIGTNDQNLIIGTSDPNATLKDKQVISTFTIGFANENPLLKDTADASQAVTKAGKRFFADDALSLATSLNAIVEDIYKTETSFSSPAVAVNAFNRAVSLNDLYFTVFKPSIGQHWAGNFKKYELDFVTDISTGIRQPIIKDGDGNAAVDPVTGFFNNDPKARSFWSAEADGSAVEAGGAANEFEINGPRKVYTYTGTYTNNSGVLKPQSSLANLTSAGNEVTSSNLAITDGSAMLNITGLGSAIPGISRRDTLLDWAAGIDVFDTNNDSRTVDMRLEMGDPLHSQPALVQYNTPIFDIVAFVATNDGYLHAINTTDGSEIFSFIPQELLSNLNGVMTSAVGSKIYGLDGDVVARVNDANKDGIISGTGEFVYLYVGMRRGGKNYYSLDVTNPVAPSLRWVIKGGVGDYADLGQTWSSINVAKVKDGTNSKDVLIFGGGYDINQDAGSIRSTDSVGNVVYIADADSGELLWSGGPAGDTVVPSMNYSIPARVAPLDISGDGNIDRLYAADMGGQILRFDIDESTTSFSPSSIKGGSIANLAVDNSPADARRFYYPPDVALIAERGKQAYLALAITSGYRAHPNNLAVHDRIYLLKDKNIYNVPDYVNPSYQPLTEAELYNATENLAGAEGVTGAGTPAENTSAQDAALTALGNTEGWYIFLDDETSTGNWIGEKGLSEALILGGSVIVTTFVPRDDTAASICSPQSGQGKVFFMNALDASPVVTSTTNNRPGRHLYNIAKEGIPPGVVTSIPENGVPTICIGSECKAAEMVRGVRRTFWNEVEE
ncbi:Type IV fimbrial biogenesis protein PilY1 [hydrothermal vent metagenome]|uniref:Type IV fimbrial biogenesis protein PilY1 n=1 Tax=hydrothermal vent metagenome TaxID=652676 RepID=A0A3B0WQY9_9ZZZZ